MVYMIEMGDVLSVRMDKDMEKRLAFLMEKRKIVDKSSYVRQLIDRSLSVDLLDYLAEEVKARRLSIWKAASIAEIPLRAMMRELAERRVTMYDEQTLTEDLIFSEGF
jgi:predicted HTH domain antitoxin